MIPLEQARAILEPLVDGLAEHLRVSMTADITPYGIAFVSLRYPLVVAAFAAMVEAKDNAELFIEWRGYRRCDIAACNCGRWHGGHANARLSEIEEIVNQYGASTNDILLAEAVRSLGARAETVESALTTARADEQAWRKFVDDQRAEIASLREEAAAREAEWQSWYDGLRIDFIGLTDTLSDPTRVHDWGWMDKFRPAPPAFPDAKVAG